MENADTINYYQRDVYGQSSYFKHNITKNYALKINVNPVRISKNKAPTFLAEQSSIIGTMIKIPKKKFERILSEAKQELNTL